jgi:hypothetical protein
VKIAPVPGAVILSVGLVILHRSSMAHMSCALRSIECDTYSCNDIDKGVTISKRGGGGRARGGKAQIGKGGSYGEIRGLVKKNG